MRGRSRGRHGRSLRRRYGRAEMLPGMEAWAERAAANPPQLSRSGKIEATSFERYNGGAATKRRWGSSTVTRFYVHFYEDRNDASKWEKIEGYGKTPGERKTFAIAEFRQRHGLA